MDAISKMLLVSVFLLVPSIIIIVGHLFTKKRQQEIPTDAKLNNLFLMSKDNAVKDALPIDAWRDIARESQKLTQEAKSYCSHTVVKDLMAFGV